MKVAVYGLPSSGKTSLIERIPNARVVSGRQELDILTDGKFSSMDEEGKRIARIQYTEFLSELKDPVVVSDGHYSFLENIVFTPCDGDVYDVIFYLYCKPSEIIRRCSLSDKNQKYSTLSEETIKQWQDFEIESLRKECHQRNKDFYVISDNDHSTSFYDFYNEVIDGLSTVANAREVALQISDRFPIKTNTELYIVDGDKTIIEQDTFRYCYGGKTSVFDGDFYSGFQSFLYCQELKNIGPVPDSIKDINLNDDVWNIIKDKPYVVLSSGITAVWNSLKDVFGFSEVIADPMISADSKFYIVKFLKEMGYRITAIGDSRNDYYMLKEANSGFLRIGNRISRSLGNTDLTGICMLYNKQPYVLSEEATQEDLDDIAVCKSNSGINGNRLASAHLRLGQSLGKKLASKFPAKNTAVLVLERGGRFFGDGLYSSFGGVFYSYNPSTGVMPEIIQKQVIIVDAVINTGKSIKDIISQLLESDPDREIVIASNVIQQAAIELLADYKVFVVRVSSNSFVGKRQAKQTGKTGPDTADRLYNIIDRSF